MKKLTALTCLVCLMAIYLTSCKETVESPELETERTTEALDFTTTDQARVSSDIPDEVYESAIDAYGRDELPAVTIAFTYTRGDEDIDLEDWSFYVYETPEGCTITEGDGQQQYPGYLETVDGFVFLESDDLCGDGTYYFDNRQGGWFDYVCGPQGFSLDYSGESVFVLVRLWCE